VETRNRVDVMPDLVRTLRAGGSVRAPGYNTATRGAGESVTYAPAGQSVIVLDGSFAGHSSIRSLLDTLVFVAARPDVQQTRFAKFYRWKGLGEQAIEVLWRERTAEEWPVVDSQQDAADFTVTPGAKAS
jgi:mannose-1-phosphate guanylyltransferase / phosphomannomutase